MVGTGLGIIIGGAIGAATDLAFIVFIPPLGIAVGIGSVEVGSAVGAYYGKAFGSSIGSWLGSKSCAPPGPKGDPYHGGFGSGGGAGAKGVKHAVDPNSMTVSGYGPQSFNRSNSQVSYRVDFENDSSATAPAQTVTDQRLPFFRL